MNDDLLQRSYDIRRGTNISPGDGFKLAKDLAKTQRFDAARRLAQHLIDTDNVDPDNSVKLHQQLALWISKNPDAPDDTKHDDALAVLDRIEKVECCKQSSDTEAKAETCGIAGGICKRKWMITGRQEDLEQSLKYYLSGAKFGVENDKGYNAINAAFVYDLLDEKQKAEDLRKQIRDRLPPIKDKPAWPGGPPLETERWFRETLAEAYFGLGDYPSATAYLKAAYAGEEGKKVASWEMETTARQFAWLARLQDPEAKTPKAFEKSDAWRVLREVYGEEVAAAAPSSLFAGKLGLALSGGGFRASLFHIGVLAALAERDLLRHVDVLSCVSGGSIVGAHYYLKVRKLLEEVKDGEIKRQHYVKLVECLQKEFLAGVQENIRMRLGANLWASLCMAFKPGYNTSKRLGELYEDHLYDLIDDDKERRLRKLSIHPEGNKKFNPKYDNWKRCNKVPILILNATSVNTGHNWQFTTSWMGESPAFIDSEIDGNYRLRRMYLKDEAPEAHRDISIGDAVAASSCVPGLFDPLELRDLYEEGVTLRLVDGGVHDNQGVFGLLDQNCSVMIVSDASGQMEEIDDPDDGRMKTLLRTTSILQARVRAAQYREIESRRRSGLLKNLMFLHLKKDLEAEDRNWINCRNPKQLSQQELHQHRADLTSYGILKRFQRHIAGIRTDLDSFNETEAFALMFSGYMMTAAKVENSMQGFPIEFDQHDWAFQKLASALRDPSDNSLERLLEVGRAIAFKIWTLWKGKRSMWFALSALLLFVIVLWSVLPIFSRIDLGSIVALGLALVAALALFRFGLRKTIRQVMVGALLSTVGWLSSWMHLLIFDRFYLSEGKVRKTQGEKVRDGAEPEDQPDKPVP